MVRLFNNNDSERRKSETKTEQKLINQLRHPEIRDCYYEQGGFRVDSTILRPNRTETEYIAK